MEPPPGMAFDFSQPAGEPALTPRDSISWRVFANPVTLFIGGVAAVILELAEPSVRAGVWEHSSFRTDPVLRLRRTGAAAMMTVYGPQSAAREMIARVVRRHDQVRGALPDGTPYFANNSRLLDWVQATASYGFIEAYSAFAAPLTPAEKSRGFAEAEKAARLYGANNPPLTLAQWHFMLAQVSTTLEPSDILLDFLDTMRTAPILPRMLRPMQRMFVRAAIDMLPADIRSRLLLVGRGLGPADRAAVRAMARLAERLPLPGSPPAQARLRVGPAEPQQDDFSAHALG
ncbi:DUF2236 domain-containing protein [Altererythrobacter xixiisoli]|uniref:DUF2236 domain-containing protein n=2 Tax=Croceibacterium xixiisoli TaxID=1476466 RepID=A0A6I4TWA6_9SPHN|nr:DUF2236 domain-containing protein [Croceibacterium xixiisoli]